MPDLSDTIDEVATGPAEASGDNTRVRAQPLQDLIAADKYQKAQAASTAPPFGIRLTKLVPPGGA